MTRAEVIAIGDEMTTGQRLDTNTQWLSQRLGELGIAVAFHSTVADDLDDCAQIIRAAIDRAGVIVITGGLGPTADDLTREAIAVATDRPLELNETALTHIEQLFAKRSRQMPSRNRLQAMFPAGSQEIFNSNGTAPGIELEIERPGDGTTVRLFALPGVPAEMKPMWKDTVASRLLESGAAAGVIRHRVIKCFGVGESRMEEMLPELIARGREPTVGITVHAATISLRVMAIGEDSKAALAAMEPTIEEIHTAIGTLAFGEADDELHHAVIRLLHDKQQTVATAESGTSGRLAHWLSETPGAEQVYRGGLVAAPTDQFSEDDAALKQLAEGGAVGVREQFGADYGLAISPLPSTDGDTEPRRYFYALATPDRVFTRSSNTAGHPAILKDRAAKQALNLLRLVLLGQENENSQ